MAGEKSYKKKPLLSSLIYGLLLPGLLVVSILMLIGSSPTVGQLLLFILLILALYARAASKAVISRSGGANSIGQRLLYAGFILLGKLPEAQGVLRYYSNRALGKTSKIIEYKIDSKQDQGSL